MSYAEGGFEDRYRVARKDGQPISPSRRFLVLDFSGHDPHAAVAIKAYAASVASENPQFADDLRRALADPENWPAQHD